MRTLIKNPWYFRLGVEGKVNRLMANKSFVAILYSCFGIGWTIMATGHDELTDKEKREGSDHGYVEYTINGKNKENMAG